MSLIFVQIAVLIDKKDLCTFVGIEPVNCELYSEGPLSPLSTKTPVVLY